MVIRKRMKISGPGMVFVTTSAKGRLPILGQESIAGTVIDQLRETLTECHVSLVGYVLMPTHLHLLLGFREIKKLSRFIQTFKSLSSRRVKELNSADSAMSMLKSDGFSLWMPRFDDVIIFSEKQFRIKLQYIHDNPVRAGLVKNAVDWEYSSACTWLEDRPGMIDIDRCFSWTGRS